jgi:hypothetical protein
MYRGELSASPGRICDECHAFFSTRASGQNLAWQLFGRTLNQRAPGIVATTGAVNTLGSGLHNPEGVAVDANGRVYAIDSSNLWKFTP